MSDPALRRAASIVALVGMAIAGYLSWVHYADGAAVCVVGGSCEKVQESEYAAIAGLPVAVLGLAACGTILALIAWDAPGARLTAAALSLVGLLFGVYLLVIQLFVIDAICVWCLANDVLIAPALAVLTGLRLRT
ncbi:MAG: vitamin K epoxide reductase family protein [Gaiellaceae bacterium]